MTASDKKIWKAQVEEHITHYGYHITLVQQGCLPRFAYTIGLTNKIGAELVFAGASIFYSHDVESIVNDVAGALMSGRLQSQQHISLGIFGTFSLCEVDDSWVQPLLLGVIDYFETRPISALQIKPSGENMTIDVPDLSRPWNPTDQPVWQWLGESWKFPIPPMSTAVTNMAALRGARITEASRWEDDEWELFAGSGPDTPKDEIRVVPVATLVAVDPSLEAAISMGVGKSLWRTIDDLEWHDWQ